MFAYNIKFSRKKLTVRRILVMVLLAAIVITGSTVPAKAATSDSAILLMASMGVITPDSSGNYNLNNTLTRAEFAKMLIEASPYDNLVASSSSSSPYKDVKSTHWASGYIKVAASKGLMSGYSDGTFRPDAEVTLEQAVNSVLLLLGYTSEDFSGAYPHAQMNMFNNTKLSDSLTGGIGSIMTKGDAVTLLYNAMGEDLKDGSRTYAESLGYSMNSSGQVDYANVISSNMNGPYTVTSSNWMHELGIVTGAVVYKNGVAINSSSVNTYDIVYYSTDKGTVWVYSDKVTGIYEKASPNQSTVTSVTVSSKEYQLESTAAFTAFSTSESFKIGSTVTLLLGKDGLVADAVPSTALTQSGEEVILYITGTGTKTFTDADGNNYTAQYLKGITPSGTEMEYSASSYASWVKPGTMAKITFNGDNVNVSKVSKALTGTVTADVFTIGTSTVSPDVKIIDTYEGLYKHTSLERLDGLTLNSSNVLYYTAVNGQVTELILNDATGDAKQYVIVTSAQSNSSGGSGGSLSGSYEYILNGEVKTYNTSGKRLGVGNGVATLLYESGELSSMRNLSGTGKPSQVTAEYVVVGNTTYYYAPEVEVYVKSASGDYRLTNIDAAISASGSSVQYYYDEVPSAGGRIRIILISE